MATTIQLDKKVKNELESIKAYPKETYSRVIERLIKTCSEDSELSHKAIRNIESALCDVKAGRVYTTKDVKKKLGI
ncbi:MAG: hypothetical protein V1678_02580 [Candidatus Aenigmatarchaeota archaeon]